VYKTRLHQTSSHQDKDIPDLPCFPQCHFLHWNLFTKEKQGTKFFPLQAVSVSCIYLKFGSSGRKIFPKKTGLRSVQVPFKTGFSVHMKDFPCRGAAIDALRNLAIVSITTC